MQASWQSASSSSVVMPGATAAPTSRRIVGGRAAGAAHPLDRRRPSSHRLARSLPPPARPRRAGARCPSGTGASGAHGPGDRSGRSTALWQRLNFLPLPHQHGSLGLSLVSGATGQRASTWAHQASTSDSRYGTGGTDDVERAGDEHEVVGAGHGRGPAAPRPRPTDTDSATMPSRSAAAGQLGRRDGPGRVGRAGDDEAGLGGAERLEHLDRIAAVEQADDHDHERPAEA